MASPFFLVFGIGRVCFICRSILPLKYSKTVCEKHLLCMG